MQPRYTLVCSSRGSILIDGSRCIVRKVYTGGHTAVAALDFPLSLVKPRTPMFLYRGWQYMAENPTVTVNG